MKAPAGRPTWIPNWGTITDGVDGVSDLPIARKDGDIKSVLEEEAGITPGLMNVVMSNEQSLIGAISYDEKLQASVWEGWKWRTEMIKGNIKRARDTCGKRAGTVMEDAQALNARIASTVGQWVFKGIFSEEEANKGLDEKTVAKKKGSIIADLEGTENRLKDHSEFHKDLMEVELEAGQAVEEFLNECVRFKDRLDEREAGGARAHRQGQRLPVCPRRGPKLRRGRRSECQALGPRR